jgi:hypothetical protein
LSEIFTQVDNLRVTTSGACDIGIRANATSMENLTPWTISCIEDHLIIELSEKQAAISNSIKEQLSQKQDFDSSRRQFVLKYSPIL